MTDSTLRAGCLDSDNRMHDCFPFSPENWLLSFPGNENLKVRKSLAGLEADSFNILLHLLN